MVTQYGWAGSVPVFILIKLLGDPAHGACDQGAAMLYRQRNTSA